MSRKKDWITAADLMAELNSDPEYLARTKAQQEAQQKLWDEWAKAEVPLVAALGSVGIQVHSVWDLIQGERFHPAAINVLLDHLKHDYPDRIREGIMRALATPHARSRWDELVEIFEHNTANLSPTIRYVAAVALSGAADETVLDDVIRLLRDRRLGFDRAPLLLALVRSKTPEAKLVVLELRDDPDLGPEIKKFRRLKRRGDLHL
jgi:HEAT repeat protein